MLALKNTLVSGSIYKSPQAICEPKIKETQFHCWPPHVICLEALADDAFFAKSKFVLRLGIQFIREILMVNQIYLTFHINLELLF